MRAPDYVRSISHPYRTLSPSASTLQRTRERLKKGVLLCPTLSKNECGDTKSDRTALKCEPYQVSLVSAHVKEKFNGLSL